MAIVTMRELLEAGIHFGHQTRRWNPKMSRYIFAQRNGIYIIDLQQTLRQLAKAYALVRDVVANGGNILFVGTKKQARESVTREAQRCGMFYVNHRWLGGTLTNWQTIRQSIRNLQRLEELDESGKLEEQFKKKEVVRQRKYAAKLNANLSGIKQMPGLPQVMFVIDAKKEAIAVREAERLGIPCIAIVDTNTDPDLVPIPVPGNDDAIRAIQLFCSIMADAVMDGRMRADKVAADKGEEAQDVPQPAAPEAPEAPAEVAEAAAAPE
ncbi:MAG: 30S ribosomal protein S2, partial [Nitrospiraceae bacterium]|nr:30S ribosomal protein S2 [Nitrospiraceae bacterium]